MTPRTRRVVGALVVLVALLFVGRWSVEFVAERWWAATLSPAAAAFVSDWQLLGLGFDVGAILIAAIWFAIQALVVARAIASVQVTRRLGNLQLREAVPTRLLLGGSIASGILLGLIAGAGAHAWRDPMVLAWRGVTYGVVDPLLNLDIGVLVAQLPAWDLVHRFAVLLAILGLAFCFALYSGIGALRRERGAVVIHPDARRHLGTLLATVALTIAAGYRLAPYHLAVASLPSLTLGGAMSRVRAADVMGGIAVATAILSLIWAFRGRNSLISAAWMVLAVGALGERYAVPALVEEGPPPPSRLAAIRRYDAIAWGIRESVPMAEAAATPAVTSLWDEAVLARLIERAGGVLEAATPAEVTAPDGVQLPVWLVATPSAGDTTALDVLAIAEGVTTGSGAPVIIRSAEEGQSARAVWRTIANPRSRPSAPPWRSVATGVNAGSPLRRLVTAWARQAPGMIGDQPLRDLDWHLDPVERAGAILPMLSWLAADLVIVNSRPVWLVQGVLPIPEFPLATRGWWRNERVAGVVPAVVCTVDATTGDTHFFADPAADSLGAAWAQVVGRLVAPASAMPAELRAGLTYPSEWLQAQVGALQTPAWNPGEVPLQVGGGGLPVPVWLAGRVPGHQVALEDGGRVAVVTVASAYRAGGMPQLRLDRRDPEASPKDGSLELRQLWNRTAVLLHLKDSVTAAGDSVWSRPTRWFAGPARAAWQTVFAVPRRGPPTLLWIASGIGDRVGGGRTPADAWKAVTDSSGIPTQRGPDEATSLESARRALQRADSAFRRGDMTAFGRAFEELRRALQRPPR